MSDVAMPRRAFLAAGAALTSAFPLSTLWRGGQGVRTPERRGGQGEGVRTVTLGVASYSLRKFPRDRAIEMIQSLGSRHVNFKSVHLPYELSAADLGAARREIEAAGLQIVGGGVITFDQDSAAGVEKYFAY